MESLRGFERPLRSWAGLRADKAPQRYMEAGMCEGVPGGAIVEQVRSYIEHAMLRPSMTNFMDGD